MVLLSRGGKAAHMAQTRRLTHGLRAAVADHSEPKRRRTKVHLKDGSRCGLRAIATGQDDLIAAIYRDRNNQIFDNGKSNNTII